MCVDVGVESTEVTPEQVEATLDRLEISLNDALQAAYEAGKTDGLDEGLAEGFARAMLDFASASSEVPCGPDCGCDCEDVVESAIVGSDATVADLITALAEGFERTANIAMAVDSDLEEVEDEIDEAVNRIEAIEMAIGIKYVGGEE